MSKTNRRFFNDKNRQSFIRWRDNTMKQMTAASSVFLGLSSAGMGYALAILDNDTKHSGVAGNYAFRLFMVSFAISFVAGLFLVINRLEDFRKTANFVKLRDENDEARSLGSPIPHPTLNELREENRLLGRKTWILFYVQLAGFGIGGGAFMWFVWCLHGTQLTS